MIRFSLANSSARAPQEDWGAGGGQAPSRFLIGSATCCQSHSFPRVTSLSSCVGMAVLKMVTYLAALTHFDSWSCTWLYKPRQRWISKPQLSEPCQGIIIVSYCFTTQLADLWLLLLFDFIFCPDFNVENTELEDCCSASGRWFSSRKWKETTPQSGNGPTHEDNDPEFSLAFVLAPIPSFMTFHGLE